VSAEREAVIWCPKCKELKGEVLRIPTGNEGVVTHRTNPDPMPKTCDCGTVLERRQ
jgi:hypothetical protein